MTYSHSSREPRRSRHLWAELALPAGAAMLAMLALAPAALAKKAPNPEFEQFADCPIAVKHVENCIVARVYQWQFPKPKGGGIVQVSYPFLLKESGD